MRPIDNLFHIVELGNNSCKVALNAGHKIYKVHFPDNPITPGVCLVQMATEIYEEISHEQLTLSEISRIKYRSVVKPSDNPTFYFTSMGNENGCKKVKVCIKDGEKVFAEMSLCFN